MVGQGEALRSLRDGFADGCGGLRGEPHMSRYTAATDADRREMLEAIGASSVEELFCDVPESLRLRDALALGGGLSEQEVFEELRRLAQRNVSTDDEVTFLGAGMYDHYVPALVDAIVLRS